MPMQVHMQNFGLCAADAHSLPIREPRITCSRAFSLLDCALVPIAFNTSSISYVVGSAHFISMGRLTLRRISAPPSAPNLASFVR
jgi:hypothetical protein